MYRRDFESVSKELQLLHADNKENQLVKEPVKQREWRFWHAMTVAPTGQGVRVMGMNEHLGLLITAQPQGLLLTSTTDPTRCDRIPNIHTQGIRGLAIHPDGMIASTSFDQYLVISDGIRTKSVLHKWPLNAQGCGTTRGGMYLQAPI
jgi:hypothetical protein